jgi:NAD(P)-dependent dehydrogenase (short-subunit alcohol dehydrogenase family)
MTTTTSKPAILYIGASRGMGYAAYTSLAHARPDLHHVLLLRSISSFKSRPEYTKLNEDVVARTTFVEGDAFNEEDVKRVLGMDRYDVQGIVYSVGPPDPTSVVQTLIHGVQFEPKDYGARGMFAILKAVAPLPKPPKLVFVTAVGMGIKGRARLPFP